MRSKRQSVIPGHSLLVRWLFWNDASVLRFLGSNRVLRKPIRKRKRLLLQLAIDQHRHYSDFGLGESTSVTLFGNAPGSGGADAFAYAGSCQANGGAGAQVLSLSCTSPVTRGSSTTCTIQGDSGVTGSNWNFTDASGKKVSGPNSGVSWSGTMVTSGTITATATYNGSQTPLSASITVNPRITVGSPFQCRPSQVLSHTNGTSPMGTLTSPPSGAEGTFGQSAYVFNYSFTYSTPNTGPNAGYTYITSFTDASAYIYELNPGLTNPNDPFYTHQYGNCGIPSVSQIVAAVQAHEYASTPSHYSEISVALAGNNPGPVAEQVVANPLQNIGNNLAQAVDPVYQSALNAGKVEPPTNLPSNINNPPYVTCP